MFYSSHRKICDQQGEIVWNLQIISLLLVKDYLGDSCRPGSPDFAFVSDIFSCWINNTARQLCHLTFYIIRDCLHFPGTVVSCYNL